MKTFCLIIIAALLCTACASFECSLGVGYRKIPPTMPYPILPPEQVQAARTMGEAMGFNPAYIEWLIKLLSSQTFQTPKGERGDLGAWAEIRVRGK